MRVGLHLAQFTWDGGAAKLGATLSEIASIADEMDVDRLSVMDHFFQIPSRGTPDDEMLESYTTLGFLAGKTTKVKLLALCTAAVYRTPGLLAKAVTTLDVLSGGRAILGLGAGAEFNQREVDALGLFFPPRVERYERMEEVLQICLQMWSDNNGPFEGEHYKLGQTVNSPQALSKPHPPILIGGGGEKKTLRLVAKYANACNLGNRPETPHKIEVLKEHCEREGTDFDAIEKTLMYAFDLGSSGENCEKVIDELGKMSELGFTIAHGSLANIETLKPLELMAERIMPAIKDF